MDLHPLLMLGTVIMTGLTSVLILACTYWQHSPHIWKNFARGPNEWRRSSMLRLIFPKVARISSPLSNISASHIFVRTLLSEFDHSGTYSLQLIHLMSQTSAACARSMR